MNLKKNKILLLFLSVLVVGAIVFASLKFQKKEVAEDLNKDGVVDSIDVQLVMSNFMKTAKGDIVLVGDINKDGVVNAADINMLVSKLKK
ncbi:MAG: hypothetical protein IPO21_14030 [Bacteroidales bacterium]|nr:hypothetical protein [Bacteroidales bacterium]